jgi:hypothetical protein
MFESGAGNFGMTSRSAPAQIQILACVTHRCNSALDCCSARQISRQMSEALNAQEQAFVQFVGAHRADFGNVTGMRFQIEAHLTDLRNRGHEPLRSPPPVEIVFN